VKVLTILLAAFGLAYACLWWSYQRFYGEFGVAPQDVGLAPSGTASDLAGSALQLGIWLLAALALMTFLPLGALVAVEAADNCWPHEKRHSILWVVSASVLLALAGAVYWWLVGGWGGLALLAGACAIFVLVVLISRRLPSSSSTLAALSKAVSITVPRVAVAIALAAAVIGLTIFDLPNDAAEAARCARQQARSVPSLNLPIAGVHLPILAVHAQPATVSWLGVSAQPLPTSKDAVYLGEANGTVILYDRKTHRALRYPAGDLAIKVDATVQTCPGVH
jgi:hypothetical protein